MPDTQSIEASLSGSIQVLVETVAIQRLRADRAEATLARIRKIAMGSVSNLTPGDDFSTLTEIREVFTRPEL